MKTLTIYFDYISPFPYFLNEYLLKNAIERRYALTIEWIPIFLGSLWPENNHMPTNASDPRKSRYSLIEAHRYAQELGVPYSPNFFKPVPVLRAALAAKRQNLFGPFHTELYRRLHGLGESADDGLFSDIIKKLGGNAGQLVQDIQNPEVKQELIRNAEQARARDVFGVPFVFYDDQPYWGYNHFPYVLKALEKSL